MKHLPLHTLILLGVFLHSGSCADSDGRCVPQFVRVGEKATIKCIITNSDQDGVYMYRQKDETQERLMYYYKDGTFTPEEPYTGRLGVNKDFVNFSVSINNVSEHDEGFYWCKFNKLDEYTFSGKMCLLVKPGNGTQKANTMETKSNPCLEAKSNLIYLYMIGVLSLIILIMVVVLVKLLCDRGNFTPKPQQSNGVYEEMRGHTTKALINPAYESSQRRTH